MKNAGKALDEVEGSYIVRFSGYKESLVYAPLAQLVEQLTLNQWVPGSSP